MYALVDTPCHFIHKDAVKKLEMQTVRLDITGSCRAAMQYRTGLTQAVSMNTN